jgi:hypothetical protein
LRIFPFGNEFLALLPALFAVFVFFVCLAFRDWRASVLLAGTSWGLAVVGLTEVLSLFHALTFAAVLIGWTALDMAAGLVVLRVARTRGLRPVDLAWPCLTRFEYVMLAGMAAICLTTGLIALLFPPDSFDSMYYHMGRIMHWIQDGSLAPYPTNILKEVNLAPGTEMEILQLVILTGGDALANLVQWLSLGAALIGISLIARELGAERRGQLLAATFAVTLPLAILQASSTENHISTALWLICFAYFCLHSLRGFHWLEGLGAALSLGLAILSKSTAYVFAAPALALLVVWVCASAERRNLWRWALSGLLVLVVNSGDIVRSYSLYHVPLSPLVASAEYGFTNTIFTPAAVTSNVVRTVALYMGTPWEGVNQKIERTIERFHDQIGIASDDPRTTWSGSGHFAVEAISLNEDLAHDPLDLLLIAGSSLYFLAAMRKFPAADRYYFLALAAAFLLFCILLKWQDWNRRLLIPLFLLACPIAGLVVGRIRLQVLANIIASAFLLLAIPWLVEGQPRSLLGQADIFHMNRARAYFATRPDAYGPDVLAVQQIHELHARNVGLLLGGSHFEYPLWVLLGQSDQPLPRIQDVGVANETRSMAGADAGGAGFVPDVIVVMADPPLSATTWQLDGRLYYRYSVDYGVVALFVPAP